VLSYNDFPSLHPGYYAFLSQQIGKEALARSAARPGQADRPRLVQLRRQAGVIHV